MTAAGKSPGGDEVVEALDNLVAALEQNEKRNRAMIRRAKMIRRLRDRGLSFAEIVAQEERPLIVEMLTENLNILRDAGGRLRRVEAQALHRDGVTMEKIAALFGVTRQRISRILSSGNGAADGRLE